MEGVLDLMFVAEISSKHLGAVYFTLEAGANSRISCLPMSAYPGVLKEQPAGQMLPLPSINSKEQSQRRPKRKFPGGSIAAAAASWNQLSLLILASYREDRTQDRI